MDSEARITEIVVEIDAEMPSPDEATVTDIDVDYNGVRITWEAEYHLDDLITLGTTFDIYDPEMPNLVVVDATEDNLGGLTLTLEGKQ